MFMTLCRREVCENAWYTVHGVSRSAYHKYKAAALAGRVNGVRAQINKRLKKTLRSRISSVTFKKNLAKTRKLAWH